MIERHVTFEVLPDKVRDFELFFTHEYRPAMASMPGYVSVDLLRARETPAAYQMVIRFESEEAAAAWRLSAAHQALSPRLKAMYSASQLQVYEVVA
jgi:heme-degrading monooxygenase HmoA